MHPGKISNPLRLFFVLVVGIFVAIGLTRYFDKSLPKLNLNNPVGQVTQKQIVVDEESVVINVVEKVSPSVVSIAVENKQLFNPLFGNSAPNEKQSGIGTGFVVSADGLILTNKHVVSSDSDKYIVVTTDKDGNKKQYNVVKITRDPSTLNDMALVKIDASNLTPVELGDSDKLKVGQKVVAIGNALGRFENTVTAGIVSGLGRGVSPIDPSSGVSENLEDLIQTDAAINPGNSGGPLVNSAGQVIGINTAIADAQNIGFAIKINVAKSLISEFNASGGKISRPLLGVSYRHISRDAALLNDVPEGEYVQQVVSGSGAAKAGVKVGDIITTLDGNKLTEENSLATALRNKKVGDSVKLRIFRDGQTIDLVASLGEATGTESQ
ncbi:trypsin-like peptidase domain-containing protein [Candidatus Curtissbacteria bacterium]|nr:trypsin-like peptidase domain-containing protein [Candidatus Curtissbacteria bacterium]